MFRPGYIHARFWRKHSASCRMHAYEKCMDRSCPSSRIDYRWSERLSLGPCLRFALRQDAASCRRDAGAPCVDETMKPTSESLSPSVTWNRRVAECYCGAAMCRGELHKANDQPQTQVNSIRPGRLASRRRGGMRPRGWVPCEACGYGHTPSSDIARSMLTGGDVRVSGVRMARRLHGLNQDPCGEQEPAAGGRALTVAMKRLITVEREGVGR